MKRGRLGRLLAARWGVVGGRFAFLGGVGA